MKSAFTLIELLIVVAIIGILAAIAVPNFMQANIRAMVARTQADMKNCATAIEQYALDYGSYPYYNHPLDEISALSGATVTYLPVSMTTPIAYLSQIPVDPFPPKVLEGSGGETKPKPYKYVHGYDQEYKQQLFSGAHIFVHYQNHSGKQGRLLWQLWSMGPDRVASHTGLPYHTSNGLLSAGDISRFGP